MEILNAGGGYTPSSDKYKIDTSDVGDGEAPIHSPLETIFVVVLTGICASIFLFYIAYLVYDTFYGGNKDNKSKASEEKVFDREAHPHNT